MLSTLSREKIYVASDYHFVNRVFYKTRVWIPALREHGKLSSSAAWLDALTVVYNFDGRLYFKDESPYFHPEIDDLFRNDCGKWFRNLLKPNETGDGPRHFSSMYERLRLVELYCRLMADADWSRWPNGEQPIGSLHDR